MVAADSDLLMADKGVLCRHRAAHHKAENSGNCGEQSPSDTVQVDNLAALSLRKAEIGRSRPGY